MAEDNPRYSVGRVPGITERLRELGDRSLLAGVWAEFRAAIEQTQARLQRDPADWGDPLHRTRKGGGMVHRRIQAPLIIRDVVYDAERAVLILSTDPLPSSPLADPEA